MTKISNNDSQKIVLNCIGKPKVAFICVHNACRSQIAEALGKLFASDVFVSFSAGTKVTSQINQDAVRLMKEIYDIDMEASQHNKLISDISSPDIVILMGCNAKCPNLNSQYTENWELDDPTGKSDVEFKKTIKLIENNIHKLIDKLS